MPSAAAIAAVERARDQHNDALVRLAHAEDTVLGPLRGTIERNHIADKIKALFAA